jgi:uncharacterized zinc-type alcohol dehydrogenase-like protein
MTVKAYAALESGGELKPFEYEPGPIGPDEVDIRVQTCGICHSDLSMVKNDWGIAAYPLVPGHEVVGTVAATGERVRHLKKGQTVGLGWFARSCMACPQCLSGDHNLCPDGVGTIVGRHGGFADRVRAHWTWTLPIPDGIDPRAAGPLFCGGITVFNPLVQNDIRPVDRVAVVGIGGLGHLALQFLNAWGCEVTAFSSSADKEEEARRMGAHHFVDSRDRDALSGLAGRFDMVLVTVNVALDWPAYIETLRPRGRLHFVGAAPEVSSGIFPLLIGQRSIGASPLGSPRTTADMLDFAARHGIAPVVEAFPMSRVNDAMAHLEAGKARYRIVLENDFD